MEEQKKTQGEAGGDSLFDGGFDTAVPERPWATLKRLWHTAQDQHLRLLVVVLSVVCYTALAIAAPYYSAGSTGRGECLPQILCIPRCQRLPYLPRY